MPTKERLADRNVTTTELALILGITGRRVHQLTQDGVLTTVSRGKFVLSDAVQAYIGSISRGGLTKEEAEEAKKIERVKAKAEATLKTSKAKIAQAEAKELSGQMHRSEDVAAMTAELIYTIRGALMALPSRVAINAAALSDPAEVAEYMRGEVNQIAEEIALFRYDRSASGQLKTASCPRKHLLNKAAGATAERPIWWKLWTHTLTLASITSLS